MNLSMYFSKDKLTLQEITEIFKQLTPAEQEEMLSLAYAFLGSRKDDR